MSQVNEIWLENDVTEFGCLVGRGGNGSVYVLRAGHTPVTEYKRDNPGVRFIARGVLFRNFRHPHTAYIVTRTPVFVNGLKVRR